MKKFDQSISANQVSFTDDYPLYDRSIHVMVAIKVTCALVMIAIRFRSLLPTPRLSGIDRPALTVRHWLSGIDCAALEAIIFFVAPSQRFSSLLCLCVTAYITCFTTAVQAQMYKLYIEWHNFREVLTDRSHATHAHTHTHTITWNSRCCLNPAGIMPIAWICDCEDS